MFESYESFAGRPVQKTPASGGRAVHGLAKLKRVVASFFRCFLSTGEDLFLGARCRRPQYQGVRAVHGLANVQKIMEWVF